MAILFLDSSVLVKRYISEVGSQWVLGLAAPGAGNVYYSHQNSGVLFVSVAEPSPIPAVSPTGGPLTFKTFAVDNTTNTQVAYSTVTFVADFTARPRSNE